ncbi:MAG: hypothetical protein WCG43_05890, partial [Actinomycetes bacterium]
MTTLHNTSTHSRPIPNPSKSLITKLNMGTGLVVGVIFAFAAYYTFRPNADTAGFYNQQNKALLAAMLFWSVGFLIGIGAFIGPFRWLIGKDLTAEEQL